MRSVRWFGRAGAVAVLIALGSVSPAWASSHAPLAWRSPNKVTSGEPAYVASIKPCPMPPPGTTILVQISVA